MSKLPNRDNTPEIDLSGLTDAKAEFKDFPEMDLPSVVYKFRIWSKKNHRKIIQKREVYLAPPSSFPDKFDCRVPIRYDLLGDSEIFAKYVLQSLENNTAFTDIRQHFQFAHYWFSKGLLRNPDRLKELEKKFFEKFDKLTGVLSLTAAPDSKPIWEEYSDNGKGFAIGFDSVRFFNRPGIFGRGGEVLYFDQLPIIKATDPFFKQSVLQVFSKLRKWEFEEEYRIMGFGIRQRKVIIEPESYSELILGWDMNAEEKSEILAAVADHLPHIKLRQAILNEDGAIEIQDLH